MPVPRQLEIFPSKPPSAEERRALIRKRLDGLEFRQRAREERRRDAIKRRKEREGRSEPAPGDQVTLDEMITRLRGVF